VNLGDVVKQVQRLFGDNFEVQIKVDDIIDWANEAMMAIVRQAETNQASASFTYGPTTDGVTLPVQFIGEKRVTFNGVPLEKTSINELDDIGVLPTDIAGTPVKFYTWGGKMYIWPAPAASLTNGLIIWYVEAPARVDDVNIQLPIPVVFHMDVVRMCLVRARELNEDYEQARILKQEIDANMGQVRFDQENRARETFPVVRDDPGDWWG